MEGRGYEDWLEDEVAPSLEEALAYDAIRVAKERGKRVTDLLRIFRCGRDSSNVDLRTPTARLLRTGYIDVLKSYRRHDEKYRRGWDFPVWEKTDDIPTVPQPNVVRTWTLLDFVNEEVPTIEHLVAYHAGVINAIVNGHPNELGEAGSRAYRRTLNTTLVLFTREFSNVDRAFNGKRDER